MNRIILLLILIISNPVYSQVDSATLDSLAKRIASSHKLTRSYQDSFIKSQDSAYHTAIDKGREDIGSQDTSLLAGNEREEKRYKSTGYVRLGIMALLLIFLVIGLFRLRKKSKQP